MNTTLENVKGTIKEVIGELTDDDALETEGEQQQAKARSAEEAEQLQDAAEEKAREAAGHAGAEAAARER